MMTMVTPPKINFILRFLEYERNIAFGKINVNIDLLPPIFLLQFSWTLLEHGTCSLQIISSVKNVALRVAIDKYTYPFALVGHKAKAYIYLLPPLHAELKYLDMSNIAYKKMILFINMVEHLEKDTLYIGMITKDF